MPNLSLLLTDAAELAADASRASHADSPSDDEASEALKVRHEELTMQGAEIMKQLAKIEQAHVDMVGKPIKAAALRALTWPLRRQT